MNPKHFETQMLRLVEVFGKVYTKERVNLIWREVKDLSDWAFTAIVDRFIGECRQAPLLPEFRELVSRERERSYSKEKEDHRREAEHAMKTRFDPTMVESICKTIGDKVTGKATEQQFADFRQGIRKLSHAFCQHCDDAGLIFEKDDKGYEWVHRCRCHNGERQPRSFPLYTPKIREAI